MNSVNLVGRLTKDPELAERGKTKVCDMRIAVNGRGQEPARLHRRGGVQQAGRGLRHLPLEGLPGRRRRLTAPRRVGVERLQALQALGARPVCPVSGRPSRGVPGRRGPRGRGRVLACRFLSSKARRREAPGLFDLVSRNHRADRHCERGEDENANGQDQRPRSRGARVHRPLWRRAAQRRRGLGRYRQHRHPRARAASAPGGPDRGAGAGRRQRQAPPLHACRPAGRRAGRPAPGQALLRRGPSRVGRRRCSPRGWSAAASARCRSARSEPTSGPRESGCSRPRCPDGRFHRADLVRVGPDGEPREAIEVELTTKGAVRLDALLRAWRRAVAERRVSGVVYRCAPRTRPFVERAIERTRTAGAVSVEELQLPNERRNNGRARADSSRG